MYIIPEAYRQSKQACLQRTSGPSNKPHKTSASSNFACFYGDVPAWRRRTGRWSWPCAAPSRAAHTGSRTRAAAPPAAPPAPRTAPSSRPADSAHIIKERRVRNGDGEKIKTDVWKWSRPGTSHQGISSIQPSPLSKPTPHMVYTLTPPTHKHACSHRPLTLTAAGSGTCA